MAHKIDRQARRGPGLAGPFAMTGSNVNHGELHLKQAKRPQGPRKIWFVVLFVVVIVQCLYGFAGVRRRRRRRVLVVQQGRTVVVRVVVVLVFGNSRSRGGCLCGFLLLVVLLLRVAAAFVVV